jgi:formyl-CoA transferase
MKFSAFTPQITGSPLLGEHTDEVLAQLGYSAAQIAKFHQDKVVGAVPPDGQHDTVRGAAAD